MTYMLTKQSASNGSVASFRQSLIRSNTLLRELKREDAEPTSVIMGTYDEEDSALKDKLPAPKISIVSGDNSINNLSY